MNGGYLHGNKQWLFIQSLQYKGVRHHHLCLAETPKQAEEWLSFVVEKRDDFIRYVWREAPGMGNLWAG